MFVGTKDQRFFNRIQQEMMENFHQQSVDYLTVDNLANFDEDEDIYNEVAKRDIVWADPVPFNAYIQTHTPEFSVEEFGGRYTNQITVMIHTNDLREREVEIREGQYFR